MHQTAILGIPIKEFAPIRYAIRVYDEDSDYLQGQYRQLPVMGSPNGRIPETGATRDG